MQIQACLCNCSLRGQWRSAGLFREKLQLRARLAWGIPLLNTDPMRRSVAVVGAQYWQVEREGRDGGVWVLYVAKRRL